MVLIYDYSYKGKGRAGPRLGKLLCRVQQHKLQRALPLPFVPTGPLHHNAPVGVRVGEAHQEGREGLERGAARCLPAAAGVPGPRAVTG